MAISETVERAKLEDLFLDPKNPRLGRHFVDRSPSQAKILERMTRDWGLEELAVSFLENGFWTQEALVVVKERLGKRSRLVVIEGNRRLAALKLLDMAKKGEPCSKKWGEIAKSGKAVQYRRLELIPYVLAGSRTEVQAYLGFRHVSGIKEWKPAEKAEFISRLIEKENLSYKQVMRMIGSKTPTVRQNYISYRLLKQMESESDKVSIPHVEERFSVLYLSLRTKGVQQYLHINMMADPGSASRPVPRRHLKNLENFAKWLFGDDSSSPVLSPASTTIPLSDN